MCGIFCCISKESNHNCLDDDIIHKLRNRGPDWEQIIRMNNLLFCGSVLWHQGKEICKQPLVSDNHALLFNGDLLNIDEQILRSDTEWLFEQFSELINETDLISCFKNLEGPYSIIFYDKRKQCVYFGRDSLGRNSLLLEADQHHIRLLSTSKYREKTTQTIELPPLGIYKICLDNPKIFTLFPWETPDEFWLQQAAYLENKCHIKIAADFTILPEWLKLDENKFSFNFYEIQNCHNLSSAELIENLLKHEEISNALDIFSLLLENSVKKRVQKTTKWCSSCMPFQTVCNHSKISVLFSGGIDCSILAILADKYVPKCEPIDLINVAFQTTKTNDVNWNVPDRLSAKTTLTNLKQLCPYRNWNLIEVDVTREQLYNQLEMHIKHLIFPLNTVLDESIGCAFWFASNSGRNSARNLARDDRVIADNGKTPRAPFIEENVV